MRTRGAKGKTNGKNNEADDRQTLDDKNGHGKEGGIGCASEEACGSRRGPDGNGGDALAKRHRGARVRYLLRAWV